MDMPRDTRSRGDRILIFSLAPGTEATGAALYPAVTLSAN